MNENPFLGASALLQERALSVPGEYNLRRDQQLIPVNFLLFSFDISILQIFPAFVSDLLSK